MHSSLTPVCGLWLEPLLVLAVGTAVIVGLAALAGRLVRSAVWQRTIWQAATVGLLGFVLVELTGTAPGVVEIVRADKDSAIQKGTAVQKGTVPFSPRENRDSPQAALGAVRTPTEQDPASEAVPAQLPAVGDPLLEEVSAAEPLGPDRPDVWDADAAGLSWPVETAPGLPGEMVFDGAPAPREYPPDPSSPVRSDRIHAVSSGLPTDSPDGSGRYERVAQSSAWLWWPVGIWLFGAALTASRFAWARLLLFAFRLRRAVVRDETLLGRAGALARRLGMRRRVTVLETTALGTPAAFGCFWPTLALPAAFSREFDPRQQEAMIAHELAHLAACDPAWQMLADLACAILWWHPLAWWSRRRLRTASELAADEASLLVPEGPDLLASCLLALAKRLARRATVGLPSRAGSTVGQASRGTRGLGWLSVEGSGFRSSLGRRVERLLGLSSQPWRSPKRKRVAIVRAVSPVVLVMIAVFCTAWAHPQANFAEGGTTMNVLQTSWRQSLAAATLAALLGPLSGDAISQEKDAPAVPAPAAVDAPAPAQAPRDREERPNPEREAMQHQVEVLAMALDALAGAQRADAAEMVERAIHGCKVTLEGRRDEEAQQIRERAPKPGQLAEALQMAAGLLRESGKGDQAEAVGKLADELRARRDREADRPKEPRERAEQGERGERGRAEREERGERERAEREERGERERGEPIRQLQEEREKLAAETRELEHKRGELREGQGEAARDLEAALKEHRERIEGIERELAELMRGQQREAAEHREAALQHLRELTDALNRARQEGRGEEAERVQREIREVTQALKLNRPGEGPPPEAREDIERRMEFFRALRGARGGFGRPEGAERPEREGPPPEAREEIERRMEHVRAAADNLRAAGLPDQAERLLQESERMLRGRPEGERPAPPRMEGPPPPEGLEGAIRELTGQIQELRARVDEMTRTTQAAVQRSEARANALEERLNQLQQQVEKRNAKDRDDNDR